MESREKDGRQSPIGCIQLFSEKSHISLRAGAMVLQPIHVTQLKFSEKMRKRYIASATVCAYLLVEFHEAENSAKNLCDDVRTKQSRICSTAQLRVPQKLH